jgi:protein tyrosine phosphatase (PTP) superfamily phosphohydrolase (DUF442 family)
LPKVDPEDSRTLHNVLHLSENIISGAEPEESDSLEQIAKMGVKTIISVDGKAPDHEAAKALGMRYVNIPIRYEGISEEEKLSIAKTFRELPGPFYVHCFHGQHRGPAAAAIGRVVLDGTSRQQALAEMRQYCGTSEKYEGLYKSIAFDNLPTSLETSQHDFDFPPAHKVDGTRQAMVELTRPFDLLKAGKKLSWASDPNHPDVVLEQESIRLTQLLRMFEELDDTLKQAEDYRGWVKKAVEQSKEMTVILHAYANGDKEAGARATAHFEAMDQNCNACHKVYRN